MPWFGHDRQTLFLSFAYGDTSAVSCIAGELRRYPQVSLDYGICSEDFEAQRADILRASLTRRLGRCALALCLLGDETLRDDWVLWSLETAHRLGIPTIASPLAAAPTKEARRIFDLLGAEIVPLDAMLIAGRVPHVPPRDRPRGGFETSLMLRTMRNPLR